MKCKTCTEQNVCNVWAYEGSTNFHRNSIKRHCNSTDHKNAVESMLTKQKRQATVTDDECIGLDSQGAESAHAGLESAELISISNDDVKLFRTVFYVATEELLSNKVNSLLELQNLNGADIRYKNLSWDTIADIQSCISTVIQRDLVSEILDSGVYAIMIDESTDLTVQKHLSVCVRFVKDGESITKFLTNVAIEDGKAHTIVSEVVECLNKFQLDPGKIVLLATDGASTMTGRKTGVGVQLKAKHSAYVVQTHCIAHRLNLAVIDSIKNEQVTVLEKFKEKFSSVYHFMSGSSNRTTKLKNIQTLLGEPELSIKEPHSIRWLGLKNAVSAVYQSYNSVLATLSNFAAEKNASAHGLLKYFSEYKTVILVAFMLDVHEVLAVLSKQLQKQDIIFSEVQPLMDATLGKLEFLESHDGDAVKAMKKCIEIKTDEDKKTAYLNGEKLLRYSDNIENELLNLRKRYVSCLQKNIKHRFRKDDSEIFKNLSLLLEPLVVSSAEETESDCEAAIEVIGLFHGENKVTKIIHVDLFTGTQEEQKEVEKLLDKDKLVQEWPMLKGMILGSYRKLSLQALCKRVIHLHKDILPNFSKLCVIALCIAVTSVECERSFSTQNRIKCKYRSSLKAENLDTLIVIEMSKLETSTYDPKKAVKLWLAKKKRRRGRLYQVYKPRVKRSKPSSSSSSADP